jgi:glycine/D-amino acid oxidase-like deaminating enzyme
MLAFELLEKNISFRIISSPQKRKASAVAAGLINPLVFKRLTKSWLVDVLLPVADEKYRNLEKLLGESFYFKKDILKPLSEQEKELWIERKEKQDFSKYIVSVEDYKNIGLTYKAAGFGRVTNSGYVNLSRFLKASDDYFRAKNLTIDADFDYKKLNPEAKSFVFNDSEAEKLVFCEGHFLQQNPFFRFVKMNPVKGEVVQIYAPELTEEFILNKKVFVLPVGNHKFKVGSTYEWNDLAETPTEAGKTSILSRFGEFLSVDFTVENHWAGIRPTISDRRPVLGVHPEFKRLSVFNGLGTKGVMLAPYFAKEMVNLLTHADYKLNEEVLVERFFVSKKAKK